jgi:hypothetical protein
MRLANRGFPYCEPQPVARMEFYGIRGYRGFDDPGFHCVSSGLLAYPEGNIQSVIKPREVNYGTK